MNAEGRDMCNWRKWILPGILATVILTALAMLFQSGSIEDDLSAKASNALQAEHPWASVELDGRDVTLNGVAPTEEAQSAAAVVADDAYDVRVVANATTLPPIENPYTFAAVKSSEGISLNGFVPSDEVRADIVAAAETSNPGIAVTDNMAIARGAPEGFAALTTFGLSQLGGLADGEASVSNTDYAIAGTAATVEAFADETDRLAAALPGGGALAASDITPPTVSPYT
ncbi:MAG: BON domain-containing protein, partial [Pseudomonadota bacterium]